MYTNIQIVIYANILIVKYTFSMIFKYTDSKKICTGISRTKRLFYLNICIQIFKYSNKQIVQYSDIQIVNLNKHTNQNKYVVIFFVVRRGHID